jgi:hypothetical protein
MATKQKDIVNHVRGDTLTMAVQWQDEDTIVYKAITNISIASGAPVLTVPGHGATDKWKGAVTRVAGMKQINAESSPPADSDYHVMTVLGNDSVEFNSVDAAKFSPYVSGGFLQYYAPIDLDGYTAKVTIWDKIGKNILASSDAALAPLDVITVSVDEVNNVVEWTVEAADVQSFPWSNGEYEVEMTSPLGVVTTILQGSISISK